MAQSQTGVRADRTGPENSQVPQEEEYFDTGADTPLPEQVFVFGRLLKTCVAEIKPS